MKITILGASGRTGRQLVQQALDRGHQVTAVVRNPAKLDVRHPRLQITVADIFDPAALRPLLAGRDALLSALGPSRDAGQRPVCSTAVAAGIEADGSARPRVVAISSHGVPRGVPGNAWWARWFMLPIIRRVLRHEYSDLARMEELLARSEVNWTVFRPPALLNGSGTGTYRARRDANISGAITRSDLALAILDSLDDPSMSRHAVGVAGPRRRLRG